VPVAGALDWHGVVDLKRMYHLDKLVIDDTMILLGKECPLSMPHRFRH
jgi:hypothetical protein